MKTTRLIGCKCTHSDVFSLAVLIGRGLDLFTRFFFTLFSFEGAKMHRHEAVSFDTVFLFSIFSTTMILYVSQVKISLRRQSVIGRASDCTVCRIVPVVCLFTISRSTVFFFLLYSCYILSLQKLTYRLICFFCFCCIVVIKNNSRRQAAIRRCGTSVSIIRFLQ